MKIEIGIQHKMAQHFNYFEKSTIEKRKRFFHFEKIFFANGTQYIVKLIRDTSDLKYFNLNKENYFTWKFEIIITP